MRLQNGIAVALGILFGILLATELVLLVMLATTARAGDGTLDGTASWYGPGTGVATHWCTWTYRHDHGCGFLAVQSAQTGLVAIAPVVDYCEVCRWTPGARLVDLEWSVVASLGLDRAQGVYEVTVWRVDATTGLPNTSFIPPN